jgi:Secretion system C-terminal sorting domain
MNWGKYFFTLVFVFLEINLFGQYQNVRVDGPQSVDPEEVSIAINPVNPNYLAAGANIDYYYSSSDGGFTWSESSMNSSLGVWGDPCLLYDSLGYVYFGHLSYGSGTGYWIDRIVVQRSTNNGTTWDDGAGIGFNPPTRQQDKEWLAVDHTQSPYHGNLYLTWTQFDDYGSSNSSDSSRIRFSKSTDAGITWSTAKTISDVSGDCLDEDNTVEGAVPAVGPNGEIYVSWAGPLGLVFDKSTDAGETWGSDVFVSTIPGGWDFNVSGISRCNGLPITMCDISNSPYRGNIYIGWSDQRNGSSNTDVFIVKSTDGGNTWSQPLKVNDDQTTRQQFFTWMTVDPATGHIWAVFYDRRNTTGDATDVFVAKSTDGGETFENFKVSESSFTPSQFVFFGDYISIAAWQGKIYPLWMRADNQALSVWVAHVIDSTTVPVELKNFSAKLDESNVLLSWETATELNNQGFEIQRSYNNSKFYTVGTVTGNGTTTENHKYSFIDDLSSKGLYNYRLKQVDFDGSFNYSDELEVDYPGVKEFTLYQNYPNPFNPETIISYELPEAGYVSLKIYDVLGNEIATIADGHQESGLHQVNFNSANFSSGIYIYAIRMNNKFLSKSMVILK